MAKGWVAIHRSIMDNPLWEDKPFSRGQAWIDLILLAAHKYTEIYIDGDMVPVEKGSLITSKRKLKSRWGWSNSKVDKFLNELEKVGMLTAKSDTKKTTIKIEKYEQYQGFESIEAIEKATHKTTQKRHGSDAEATQKRHGSDTEANIQQYNNYNNDNNDNNDNNIAPSALPSEPLESEAKGEDDEDDTEWIDFGKITDEEFEKVLKDGHL